MHAYFLTRGRHKKLLTGYVQRHAAQPEPVPPVPDSRPRWAQAQPKPCARSRRPEKPEKPRRFF
jgi:hypothetical protein